MHRAAQSALVVSLMLVSVMAVAPVHAQNLSVLVYGPAECTGCTSSADIAAALGYSVTVASASQWASMTTQQFASYAAIIIPDGECGSYTNLNELLSTASYWSPAVTGPIVAAGFDPEYHYNSEHIQGAYDLIANGVVAAASGTSTGFFFEAGCYGPTAGSVLSDLNAPPVNAYSYHDNAETVLTPSSPLFNVPYLITSGSLSNWLDSSHTELSPYCCYTVNAIDSYDYPVVMSLNLPSSYSAPLLSGSSQTQAFSVSVNAQTASGSPITDATVTIGGQLGYTGIGDAVTFQFIAAGTYALTVSAPGFATYTANVNVVDYSTSLTVTLSASSTSSSGSSGSTGSGSTGAGAAFTSTGASATTAGGLAAASASFTNTGSASQTVNVWSVWYNQAGQVVNIGEQLNVQFGAGQTISFTGTYGIPGTYTVKMFVTTTGSTGLSATYSTTVTVS